ncbi:MAG: COX15/CtaA family protein [Planctomycetales bacterium]
MSDPVYHRWLHRYAVLTATMALLLPILVGAIVTTRGAGMAFPDWPSSDGQNMFLYPWLASAGDKFLEHGHRLAGSFVGVLSIGLAFFCWKTDERRWIKGLGGVILLAVIIQGYLGGKRVLNNDPGIALIHGVFASWVFALMSVIALVTSRTWFDIPAVQDPQALKVCRYSSLITVLLVATQYFLGAFLRHKGTAVYEHIGFAFIVVLAAMWLFVSAANTRIPWLVRPAFLFVAAVMFQLLVGAATYVVKFGFENFVPQQESLLQVSVRTGHVLMGMLVWMLAVIYAVRVQRLISARTANSSSAPDLTKLTPSVTGGAS